MSHSSEPLNFVERLALVQMDSLLLTEGAPC